MGCEANFVYSLVFVTFCYTMYQLKACWQSLLASTQRTHFNRFGWKTSSHKRFHVLAYSECKYLQVQQTMLTSCNWDKNWILLQKVLCIFTFHFLLPYQNKASCLNKNVVLFMMMTLTQPMSSNEGWLRYLHEWMSPRSTVLCRWNNGCIFCVNGIW